MNNLNNLDKLILLRQSCFWKFPCKLDYGHNNNSDCILYTERSETAISYHVNTISDSKSAYKLHTQLGVYTDSALQIIIKKK